MFILVKFIVCKCFQFGVVQNFVMWEWVKEEQYENIYLSTDYQDVSFEHV